MRRSARAEAAQQKKRALAQPLEQAAAVHFTLAPVAIMGAAEVPPEGDRGVCGGSGGGIPPRKRLGSAKQPLLLRVSDRS